MSIKAERSTTVTTVCFFILPVSCRPVCGVSQKSELQSPVEWKTAWATKQPVSARLHHHGERERERKEKKSLKSICQLACPCHNGSQGGNWSLVFPNETGGWEVTSHICLLCVRRHVCEPICQVQQLLPGWTQTQRYTATRRTPRWVRRPGAGCRGHWDPVVGWLYSLNVSWLSRF